MPEFPATSGINHRYTVLRTLGDGAFRRALLAGDNQTADRVIIKVLDTRNADD